MGANVTQTHKLTAKQLRAAEMLACGENVSDTAKILELRRETVQRWKRLPGFQATMEESQRVTRESLRARFLTVVDRSLDMIAFEMHDSNHDRNRVRSAIEVLKLIGIDRLAFPAGVASPALTDTHPG